MGITSWTSLVAKKEPVLCSGKYLPNKKLMTRVSNVRQFRAQLDFTNVGGKKIWGDIPASNVQNPIHPEHNK
jgi:hypothetical protein